MTTVKSLNLENVSSISDPGWRSFATVLLPSSTSNLKELKLGGNDEAYLSNIIYGDVFLCIIMALAINTSLEILDLGIAEFRASSFEDWNNGLYNLCPSNHFQALYRVLYDESSIDSLYHSNHTLRKFSFESDFIDYPAGIRMMLSINDNENKWEVVRTKLLMSEMFAEFNNARKIFGRMETSIMPSLIKWIGNDRLGFSSMYCLSKTAPWLFQFGSNERVSKI